MKTFVVSFGNSRKYRVESCCADSPAIKDVKKEVLEFLKEKFPLLDADRYYDYIEVVELTPENREEYGDCPLLTPGAVSEIKDTLTTEVLDEESLRRLDSNAPYADI